MNQSLIDSGIDDRLGISKRDLRGFHIALSKGVIDFFDRGSKIAPLSGIIDSSFFGLSGPFAC